MTDQQQIIMTAAPFSELTLHISADGAYSFDFDQQINEPIHGVTQVQADAAGSLHVQSEAAEYIFNFISSFVEHPDGSRAIEFAPRYNPAAVEAVQKYFSL